MNTDHVQQAWPPSEQGDDGGLVIDSDDDYGYAESDADLEAGDPAASPITRRRSNQLHRDSVEDPLLEGMDSNKVEGHREFTRTSQRIYIETEDLTIVVAGFTTSPVGSALHAIISTLTCGIGWLILRWMPRWRIRLVGKQASLQHCEWVVVEVEPIYYAASTIFRLTYNSRINGMSSACIT